MEKHQKGGGHMEDKERYKAGERAIAPTIGIVVPILTAVVIAVVTAVTSVPRQEIRVDIAEPVSDPDITIEDPPEPPEPPEPDVVEPKIEIDPMPMVKPSQLVGPAPQPDMLDTPSVKPAPESAVKLIKSVVKMPGMPISRFPGDRGKYTGGGDKYGDVLTESTVLKALRWLKKTQRTDGSWNGNPISNTGLAVLAYLAHGEKPGGGEFGSTVMQALDYLIVAQEGEGDGVRFRGADGNEYAFLIATYALCEAYGMTRNPNARAAAMKGIKRIVRNQSPTGGWDYKLNRNSKRDDLSFAGWALQALKAGKMAGLHPEGLDECIKKAMNCLEKRNFRDGGFGYTAGGRPTGLTATGCLAMQLLGYGERPEVTSALDYMREWRPAFEKEKMSAKPQGVCPQYYCYYATQCKYQAGMKPGATPADVKAWQEWNVAMKALYPKTIVTCEEKIADEQGRMCEIGYWTNGDTHGSGDTMATCLCALQLMVYYRYLPTMQAKIGGMLFRKDCVIIPPPLIQGGKKVHERKQDHLPARVPSAA